MALTTRTYKGQLALDSADGNVNVWLVVKPHWREARKSVAQFVPPNRFICYFFYRANTAVTKHVRLDERPDRNELLLVDGALVVSETQLESLIEAGNFVRLPRTKVLSFAQFCRVVASKARVAVGTMTITEFYNQLQLCMLADHADVVMNNSITLYFWRKSFTHPHLTSASAKYQGLTIPEMDWPLPAFKRTDSEPSVKREKLPKRKVPSDSLKAKTKEASSSCAKKSISSKRLSVKEEPVVSPSADLAKSKKAIKVKTESSESAKKELSKTAPRKRSSSLLVQTPAVKRRHFGTQTQIRKPKQCDQSTQTAGVATDSSLENAADIQPTTSAQAPPPEKPQRMTAALFLSHLSHLSAFQTNVSSVLPFPPFPLSTPFSLTSTVNDSTMANNLSPALLNAGVIGIRENGDVEVAAPETVIRMLGSSLPPLPSAF